MKEERLKRMEEFLKQNDMCSLDVLCDVFNISKVTVRRDIDELYKAGIVEKIYGGVRFRKRDIMPTISYGQRDALYIQEKELIGRLAASVIHGGDTVFIDSGTTTPHLLKYVTDMAINVVSHSLNAVEECRDHENINIIILGGEFNRLTNSFTGDNAIRTLNHYNISKAFLAATGASTDYGFTNSAPVETGIKKEAIARCQEKYIMIDHSKWDVVSLRTFAPITEITGVITDMRPPERYMSMFIAKGIRVLYEEMV